MPKLLPFCSTSSCSNGCGASAFLRWNTGRKPDFLTYQQRRNPAMKKIALIGTGVMGQGMARNLMKNGFE
ncbi:MAG: hypothetical protein IJ044_03035, partial [Oscillospiraceae bacterium]|nr:hypothetical protein [Oscillospiraceae bacterium]